jgi:hypothetical protein
MTATIPGVEKSGSRSAGSFSANLNSEHGNQAYIYSLNWEAGALSADTCTENREKRQIVVRGWNREQCVATKALIVDKGLMVGTERTRELMRRNSDHDLPSKGWRRNLKTRACPT